MTPAGDGAAQHAGNGVPDAIDTAQANLLWARALVEGLVAAGVRRVCLSPGSRSSPLAFAVHLERRLAVSVQVDERSAAFLALGFAKATRSPVALVCTSGTAAANFLPALAEAFLAGVPLVVLSADRPPELRATGAPQTIDQIGLYGSHVRLFRDLPCPDEAGSTPAMALSAASEACRAAVGSPAGPVHLNVPFREPLVPAPEAMAACEAHWNDLLPGLRETPPTDGVPPLGAPGLPVLAGLASRLAQAKRPLLLAGPEAVTAANAQAVFALASAAGLPIVADIASGLRGAPVPGGVCCCALADLFLRDDALAALAPDLVLRLGGIPTSKVVAGWLARHRPPLVAIQPDARRRDPDGVVGEVIVADAAALCAALATHVRPNPDRDGEWPLTLKAAEASARAMLAKVPREAAAVVAACAATPPGSALFLSSSMPIRWAEFYVPALADGVEVFVNRGANGIDGIVSTAIGVAGGSGVPTLLVTGDLAFLHDAGGLRAARELRSPLAILLLENGGGGIFSHLPVARHEGAFEPFFGTPHGCDLAALSGACGIDHVVAGTLEDVSTLTAQTLSGGGVRVIEWRTDRAETAREQDAFVRLPGVRVDRVGAWGFAWQVRRCGLQSGLPLVLLHGFTGTGEFWVPVVKALPGRHCIFPDLPGHGGTDAPPERWQLDHAANALAAMLDELGIERFALAGYSMGGRMALSFALRHPKRVAALALIGTSPGIDDVDERVARAASDLELAETIERDGIEAFSQQWEESPLFATQAGLAPALRDSMRSQRLGQDPARLAAALRAFGTGFQPPVHDALAGLRPPVLVMAGEQDAKYVALARDMAARIPRAELRIVPEAGHAVPLERAADCAVEIEHFLRRNIDA